jgi:hypothetical protein
MPRSVGLRVGTLIRTALLRIAMTSAIVGPVTRPDWGAHAFPPEVVAQVAETIIGGSPFGDSLGRDVTRRGGGARATW